MLKIKTKAIFVLCFAKFTTVSSQTLICDPLDNVSYHKQLDECMKCDTCPLGYGKVTLEESGIEIDPPFGSYSCIPCRPCKQGFYSDVHSYKCKLCTNCTELQKSERKSCTSKVDTVCGEQVLIGVIKVKMQVKRKDESHKHTHADSSSSVTVAIIISELAMIILFGGLCVGYVGYRRWKSKRAQQRQSVVQTEAGQCVSNDRGSCSYRPNRDQGEHGTYTELDEIHEYYDTDDKGDDETMPLIPKSGTLRQQRTRHNTYPFCGYQADDSVSDVNVCDIELDTHSSLSKRYSYPDVGYRRGSVESNILEFGFMDFTLRQEPHKILSSFNAQGINSMIEKVQEWDRKYEWSEKNSSSNTHSAHIFLAKYARGQKSALQKVQQWENKGSIVL